MINYAHRGASYDFPENTMLAFREAIIANADAIELDVHKTLDNKLVVIHDEDVQRTFKGKGLVADMTLAQIQQLKCRSKVFEDNLECRAPELEQVMLLVKNHGLKLNIELKTDVIQYDGIEADVVNLVQKHDMVESVIISSFNGNSIKKVKELNSNIKTGFLYGMPQKDIVQKAKDLNADALHPSIMGGVNAEYMAAAKEAGLEVNVFFVNDIHHMRKLVSLGVDGVFTDYPELFNEILAE
ncbi:MAG: glycerophosphodiester phosphodiesterase [Epulopiscium sp. Nele67-Bin002]|nr:MAG: glycerophosphodiester phosphodiesterase [Epulopiscium sp. Nele67-Bin002]